MDTASALYEVAIPSARTGPIYNAFSYPTKIDAEAIARAALVVADMPEEVLHETGDAMAAAREGIDLAAKLVSLSDIGTGKVTARKSDQDIVIYKSVGSALQDVVIAEMILERALAAGTYFEMPESIHTIIK